MSDLETKDEREGLRRTIFVVIFSLFTMYSIALTVALFVVFIWPRPPRALLTKLIVDHFSAIAGLPLMAVAAFIVVWAFRATEGWGLKLRGASGPILLWVITFLSIALSLRMFW